MDSGFGCLSAVSIVFAVVVVVESAIIAVEGAIIAFAIVVVFVPRRPSFCLVASGSPALCCCRADRQLTAPSLCPAPPPPGPRGRASL